MRKIFMRMRLRFLVSVTCIEIMLILHQATDVVSSLILS